MLVNIGQNGRRQQTGDGLTTLGAARELRADHGGGDRLRRDRLLVDGARGRRKQVGGVQRPPGAPLGEQRRRAGRRRPRRRGGRRRPRARARRSRATGATSAARGTRRRPAAATTAAAGIRRAVPRASAPCSSCPDARVRGRRRRGPGSRRSRAGASPAGRRRRRRVRRDAAARRRAPAAVRTAQRAPHLVREAQVPVVHGVERAARAARPALPQASAVDAGRAGRRGTAGGRRWGRRKRHAETLRGGGADDQKREPGSARNASSSGVDARPRIALRCG